MRDYDESADMSPDMSAPFELFIPIKGVVVFVLRNASPFKLQKSKWETLVLDHDYCLKNSSLSESICTLPKLQSKTCLTCLQQLVFQSTKTENASPHYWSY